MGAAKGLPTRPTSMATIFSPPPVMVTTLPTSQPEIKKKKPVPNPSPPQRSSPRLKSTIFPRFTLGKFIISQSFIILLSPLSPLSSTNDSLFYSSRTNSCQSFRWWRRRWWKWPSPYTSKMNLGSTNPIISGCRQPHSSFQETTDRFFSNIPNNVTALAFTGRHRMLIDKPSTTRGNVFSKTQPWTLHGKRLSSQFH